MDELKLELDDQRSYDKCAVMTFQTNLQGFQFAAMLNRCAAIRLTRSDFVSTFEDLTKEAIKIMPPLPIYTFIDESAHLTYRLIDTDPYTQMPSDLGTALQWHNKILFIIGTDCYRQQETIYTRLSGIHPKTDAYDIRAKEIAQCWQSLADNIIDFQYYNLSDRMLPKSSRWTSDNATLSPKVRLVADRIEQFLSILLQMIESCDYNNETKNLQKRK